MYTPEENARRKIALVWYGGGGLLFVFILIQTFFGRYGTQPEKAWTWLLPTIMPTLSLITGVLVAKKPSDNPDQSPDPFLFRLAMTLSIFYLAVVFMTLLLAPLSELTIYELMAKSNLWLAPMQGLVTASLGVFFTQKKN